MTLALVLTTYLTTLPTQIPGTNAQIWLQTPRNTSHFAHSNSESAPRNSAETASVELNPNTASQPTATGFSGNLNHTIRLPLASTVSDTDRNKSTLATLTPKPDWNSLVTELKPRTRPPTTYTGVITDDRGQVFTTERDDPGEEDSSYQLQNEAHIYLKTRDVAECSRNHGHLGKSRTVNRTVFHELFALSGSIRVEAEAGGQGLKGDVRCDVKVRVPRGVHVLFEVLDAVNAAYDAFPIKTDVLAVSFNDSSAADLPVQPSDVRPIFVFSSSFRGVKVRGLFNASKPGFGGPKFRIYLRFEVLRRSGLEIQRTSRTAGFIQTPLYDGKRFLLTILSEPEIDLDIPAYHKVMVSFPFAEVSGCVVLQVQTSPSSRATTVMSTKRGMPPSPGFYKASRLNLGFDQACGYVDKMFWNSATHLDSKMTGFRMRFSFYNSSSVPEQVPGGLWNCTVAHWYSFRDHFRCNFRRECWGKEDETGCPYTTESCGPGHFPAGDTCLFIVRDDKKMTSWIESSDLCLNRGGQLASLKTNERYEDARRILQFKRWTQTVFFIGLRSISPALPPWYDSVYQWTDGTMAFENFTPDAMHVMLMVCGRIKNSMVAMDRCNRPTQSIAICEKRVRIATHRPIVRITLTAQAPWPSGSAHVTCPSRHVTHTFLACDVQSACWSKTYESCAAQMTPLPPSFPCRNLVQHVPYSLVCDYRPDCVDSSDEDFCVFKSCGPREFSCGDKRVEFCCLQCIPRERVCDQWRDCFQGTDEVRCSKLMLFRSRYLSPPAVMTVDWEEGLLVYEDLNRTSPAAGTAAPSDDSVVCPDTHFLCPNNGFCLPVFLRCNGVTDCTFHEDEADCDLYTCPGFYRCRASTVCAHRSHVCDGRTHCPQHDDELLCGFACPPSCACRGLAFFCTGVVIRVAAYPTLRYLHARGTNMTFADLKSNLLLIFLSLAFCHLTDRDAVYHLPNLMSLDLGDNLFTSVNEAMLKNLPRVQRLSLSGNPLVRAFEEMKGEFRQLHVLDLSRVHVPQLNVSIYTIFPNLHTFNMSDSQVQTVLGRGFEDLKQLRTLDLRGCPITEFPGQMFQRLANLEALYAQSFQLCCPVLLPANFNPRKCVAPDDDVSSCQDLLGSVTYKISAFVFALAALVANSTAFVYRTFVNKNKSRSGFSEFVTHLSISDFLMGIYLAFIGLADRVYKGSYLWNDVAWRHSPACSLAGFLSLLSSESSALIVCLITVDRFLVLCFPFSRLHFGVTSAHVACLVVWLVSLVLASIPLLPLTSHWQFYSQTGICIPLPITRTNFPGRIYSFSIVIVLNFALFVFISLGQLLIYWSVRANSMSVNNTTQKTKDMTIARRLITVAMSDFLCWFPIGLLGLLASSGFPIPRRVNVIMAVFVLPLNSALNPFLYTVNVILERRRRAREEKMRMFLMAQLSKKG